MQPSMLDGGGRSRHVGLGQLVDRLEEDRAVRRAARRPGCGALVQRPLQARVADVDGEEADIVRSGHLAGAGCTSQPLMRQDCVGLALER